MDIILIFASAISFWIYGFTCLFSSKMKKEFERFGVPQFRVLTGVLEIGGGTGQVIGWLFSPTLLKFATIGLALLMLLGFLLRIKIKDSFIQSSPAFIFMVINIYIFLKITL